MIDFSSLGTMDVIYIALSAVLVVFVLFGIYLMSKVKHARLGNGLSAIAMLCGIILVLIYNGVFDFAEKPTASVVLGICIILAGLLIGATLGLVLSKKVKMIQMPQMVALLNGLGGAASAVVGLTSLIFAGKTALFGTNAFVLTTSSLAVSVGMITLLGSLVAAGKLHRVLPQNLGYAGVENPLYQRTTGVHLFLGNAADTLTKAIAEIK